MGLQSRTTLSALQLYATVGQQHSLSLAGPSSFVLWTDSFWEHLSGLSTAHCVLRVRSDVLPVRVGPARLRLCSAAAHHVTQLVAVSVSHLLLWVTQHGDMQETNSIVGTV